MVFIYFSLFSLPPFIFSTHTRQIEGFASLDVALGMYERTYYHLVPVSASSSLSPGSSTGGSGDRGRGGGAEVVVNIDRTAGTPVVTLRSPLQVGGPSYITGRNLSLNRVYVGVFSTKYCGQEYNLYCWACNH